MASQRPRPALRLPLTGPGALLPALGLLTLVIGAGLGYAVAQSLGLLPVAGSSALGIEAYRDVLGGHTSQGGVGGAAAFTLWVSAASTVLAGVLAIAAVAWIDRLRSSRRAAAGLLHLNLAIPHVVWAVALLLLLSQSGILARAGAGVGLIDTPADTPIVVRDGYGIGIILHYAGKEAPFLALVGLALLRAQPRELGLVAGTLGATGWRRVRMFVLPTILPGIAIAGALVFAFVFGAYEAPVALGVSSPRMLSVLGLDLYNSPDLADRPAAMALGVLMTAAVMAAVWMLTWLLMRRRR